MVFLVGHANNRGTRNYLVPLMIGTRDMAFPRFECLRLLDVCIWRLLLYFSYLGDRDSTVTVPRRRRLFAYAPLTGRPFPRGHSTDYWILSLRADECWKHGVGHQRHRGLP